MHYASYSEFGGLSNIHLFHYAWMKREPAEVVRQIAKILAVELDDAALEAVLEQSAFDHMKKHAEQFAPDADRGLYRNSADFFSVGANGQWAELLSDEDVQVYNERFAELLPEADRVWLSTGLAP